MKPTLLAAFTALAMAPTLDARYAPSANGIDPVDPIIAPDLRLRLPNGRLRPDLSSIDSGNDSLKLQPPSLRDLARPRPPRPMPAPRPITPLGDGEIYALHGPRGPQILPLEKMPMIVVDGVAIDPKMPMKGPDPTVDYKLHVREMTPPGAAEDSAKK